MLSLPPLPEGGEVPEQTVAAESEAPESEAPEGETELDEAEASDSSRTKTSIPSAHSDGEKAQEKRKRSPEDEDSGSSKLCDPTLTGAPINLLDLAQDVSS